MAVQTFPSPPTVPNPDYKSKRSAQVRIMENEFGDGYTQRALDGLNARRDTYSPVWTNLTTIEKDNLIDFFELCNGALAFTFTVPGDPAPKKFTCRQWDDTPNDFGYWNVNATFIQVFDL